MQFKQWWSVQRVLKPFSWRWDPFTRCLPDWGVCASLFGARHAGLVLITSAVCLSQGCGINETPEEAVARRAQERMDALIAQDFPKAFEYASPAYREALGIEGYTRRYAGSGAWRAAEVEQAACDADACDVSIRLTYMLAPMGDRGRSIGVSAPNTRSISEKWISVDGKWYIYLQ